MTSIKRLKNHLEINTVSKLGDRKSLNWSQILILNDL